MLAETVSFTDEEILAILLVLLGMAAAAVAVVVLGCVFAWRAGRGSQAALAAWIVVASLEAVVALLALPALLRSGVSPILAAPIGALAAQVGLYVGARNKEDPGR